MSATNHTCDGSIRFPGESSSLTGVLNYRPVTIAHPGDVDRLGMEEGVTQFTYDDDAPTLELEYASSAHVSSPASEFLENNLRWRTPRIGESCEPSEPVDLVWSASDAWYGSGDRYGKGWQPTVVYQSLPHCIEAFGRNEVILEVFNPEYGTRGTGPDDPGTGYATLDEVTFEVFFPKRANNHPPTHPVLQAPNLESMPNWAYYYIQKNQPPVSEDPAVHWEYNPECDPSTHLGQHIKSPQFHGENLRTRIYICGWCGEQEIQLRNVASVSEHEQAHDVYLRTEVWRHGPYWEGACRPKGASWDDCGEPDNRTHSPSCWFDCLGVIAPQVWLKDKECFWRDDEGEPIPVKTDSCFRALEDRYAYAQEEEYCNTHEHLVWLDFANPGPNIAGGTEKACLPIPDIVVPTFPGWEE